MVRFRSYYLIAIIVAIAVIGWILVNPVEDNPYIDEDVTFLATDGIEISATWYVPKSTEPPFSSVILVHQFDGDRHEWDPFISDFIERGYAILAYDLRGFGNSQNVPKTNTDEYYDTLIKDVEGAISWLNNRPDVISDELGVVGAQLGGTVAYAASALIDEVKVAVAISPAPNVGNLLLGESQEDFNPNNILFQFLDTERIDIQPLIDKSGEPNTVRLYRPESPSVRASGISLLHRDLRALSDLLRFLDDNL
jgi:pimeloyl-ACP methyl ester carboxylesterase